MSGKNQFYKRFESFRVPKEELDRMFRREMEFQEELRMMEQAQQRSMAYSSAAGGSSTAGESSNPGVVTSNLRLYYDPSLPSSYPGSGTTINDISGNGNDGTMSNISFTSPYFTYGGTSSQISIADNPSLEPGSGDWTMEAWVNITGFGGIIFGKTDGGLAQDWGYGLRTSGAGQTFGEIGNGSPTSLQTDKPTLIVNNWYQIVAVWTNVATNSFEIFINGISQGTKSHSFTSVKNTTSPLFIGSFNNGEFPQWFNGEIGVTRLYSSALSSAEILQNFNADKSKYGI